LSIQESEIQLVEYDNKIRQLKWDTFDFLQSRIGSITDEADFLIDLLEFSDLFDDNGTITNTGNATLGLHAVNYDVYAEQVRQYTDALRELEAEISNDPYDTELIKRREALLKLQRDSVLAMQQEKKAIVDLVEDGIKAELDALRELIDKYNDSLDSEKDMYDYQKKVSQQSKTIASLQKQIAAYSGDTSEENRARLQKLREEYENANEELQETQYEKYISDQKRLLDDLYNEYESLLNSRLDNVDALMREIINATNMNSGSIRATIESECGAVGITMTQVMDDIWSPSGKAGAVVTTVTNGVLDALSNVGDVIIDIEDNVGKMVAAGEATGEYYSSTANTILGISDKVSKVYDRLGSILDAIKDVQTEKTTSDSDSGLIVPEIDMSDADFVLDLPEVDLTDGITLPEPELGGIPEIDAKDLDLSGLTVDLGLDDISIDIDIDLGQDDIDIGGSSSGIGLVSNGFASGGFVAGAQKSAYKNGDDIITFNTLKSGEAVLTPEQAAQFEKLVNHLPVLQKMMDVNSHIKTLTPVASTGNNINMGGFNLTFQIDHVQDYNDLVRQMRDDKRFEKMIQTMTVDPLVGRSTLAKRKFYN